VTTELTAKGALNVVGELGLAQKKQFQKVHGEGDRAQLINVST